MGRQVDLIVCDMNMLPHLCAECMDPFLPFLKPGGFVILTCKLTGVGRHRCGPYSIPCAWNAWCLSGLTGGNTVDVLHVVVVMGKLSGPGKPVATCDTDTPNYCRGKSYNLTRIEIS